MSPPIALTHDHILSRSFGTEVVGGDVSALSLPRFRAKVPGNTAAWWSDKEDAVRGFGAAAAFAAMLAAGQAGATESAETALDLLDAPVAYTAHFTVSGPQGSYEGRVWHVHGRERREWVTASGTQAVLIDRGADAAYLLSPAGKWYVGFGLHAAAALAGGLDGLSVERHRLGEETVGGVRATRYRIAATDGEGRRFDGDTWFSRDGIMVKAAGKLTADGKVTPVETGLSQLAVGSADPSQLQLPGGYFGMDLRTVPPDQLVKAVNGLKPMLEGRAGR